MDNLNDNLNEDFNGDLAENLNETRKQASGCLRRFSKSIKAVVIAFLILLLLIPMFMIEDMISERGRTQTDAITEVGQKWSLAQTITGPYINLKYPITQEDNGTKKVTMGNVTLLPDELSIDGQLSTEILRRGIYKVNVYQSELVIKGFFSSEELRKSNVDMDVLQYQRAAICLNLTDMRGGNYQVTFADNAVIALPDFVDERSALRCDLSRIKLIYICIELAVEVVGAGIEVTAESGSPVLIPSLCITVEAAYQCTVRIGYELIDKLFVLPNQVVGDKCRRLDVQHISTGSHADSGK